MSSNAASVARSLNICSLKVTISMHPALLAGETKQRSCCQHFHPCLVQQAMVSAMFLLLPHVVLPAGFPEPDSGRQPCAVNMSFLRKREWVHFGLYKKRTDLSLYMINQSLFINFSLIRAHFKTFQGLKPKGSRSSRKSQTMSGAVHAMG